MKIAKEITIDDRTYTVFECQDCGATTRVPGRQTSQKSQAALIRRCGSCSPGPSTRGWWHDLGLSKNPYVYGPMQRMRTSQRFRLEEARRMGWVAYVWQDEYTNERLGSAHNGVSRSLSPT